MSAPVSSVIARAGAIAGLVIAGVSISMILGSSKPPTYGAKVTFAKRRPLSFPDFKLEYLGSRRVQPPQYPRGWVVHDFVASTATEKVPVSWSAGTGDIGPRQFAIAGKEFWLELVHSDKLGRLKDDQLVVTLKGPAS